jgi:hypothetical protein
MVSWKRACSHIVLLTFDLSGLEIPSIRLRAAKNKKFLDGRICPEVLAKEEGLMPPVRRRASPSSFMTIRIGQIFRSSCLRVKLPV